MEKIIYIIFALAHIAIGGYTITNTTDSGQTDSATTSQEASIISSTSDTPATSVSEEKPFDSKIVVTLSGTTKLFMDDLSDRSDNTKIKFESTWHSPETKENYDVDISLSLPKSFPSETIENSILKDLKVTMKEFFDLIQPVQNSNHLYSSNDINTTNSSAFIRDWQQAFKKLNNVFSTKSAATEYVSARAILSFNKIYEDSDFITYVISSGNYIFCDADCDNDTSYITFNKHTGKRLKLSDLQISVSTNKLNLLLLKAYKAEVKARDGYDMIESLQAKNANSVAIVQDGLLFDFGYLGDTVEGAYSLLLPAKITLK